MITFCAVQISSNGEIYNAQGSCTLKVNFLSFRNKIIHPRKCKLVKADY